MRMRIALLGLVLLQPASWAWAQLPETAEDDFGDLFDEPNTTSPPAPPVPLELESAEAPVNPVKGTVQKVTLYRDRARVTRAVPITAEETPGVVTVTDLPTQLIASTVYAEGDTGVEIRGVRITSRVTGQSDRQDVRELEAKIEELTWNKADLEQKTQVLQENLQTLGQVVQFSSTKTADDLNRGTLDAATTMELTEYLMEQRLLLNSEQLQLQQELAKVDREINVLQYQLNSLVAQQREQSYSATIFYQTIGPDGGTIQLNYQVTGCGWSPQYAIRGSLQEDGFQIRYSAMIEQITGEDWDQVELVLSTASPSVSATGPILTPFRVSTATGDNSNNAQQANQAPFGGYGGMMKDGLAEQFKSLRRQQRSVENKMPGQQVAQAPMQRDLQLNSLATQIQQLELQAEAKVAARIADDADDDVATQTYALQQAVSLPSRRQQQLVQISQFELQGKLYHVATPLLSSYAYRQAEMTNSQSIGLLGGPVSVYLDDRFVGMTEIPTTASGQRLLIGFGADQQVRTRRELRAKEDTIRGGNRQLEFTYRLVLANFKDQPVNVQLVDRMPLANQSRDVTVSLAEPQRPLSTDPLYQRIDQGRGILRWDLEIPASSHGDKAFDIDYTYQLEFDRSRTLSAEELAANWNNDYFGPTGMGGGMGGMGGMGAGSGNGSDGGYPGGYPGGSTDPFSNDSP